jgi:hypothetical protein
MNWDELGHDGVYWQALVVTLKWIFGFGKTQEIS